MPNFNFLYKHLMFYCKHFSDNFVSCFSLFCRHSVALHPKKQILATTSDDQTWKMWSIPNGDIIMTGEGHTDWVADCDFRPEWVWTMAKFMNIHYLIIKLIAPLYTGVRPESLHMTAIDCPDKLKVGWGWMRRATTSKSIRWHRENMGWRIRCSHFHKITA